MTKTTQSTYRIRERAARAIEAGHEYVFIAPDGARVRIGYVGGGSFVRVDVHAAPDDKGRREMLDTDTAVSTRLLPQIRRFVSLVNSIGVGGHLGDVEVHGIGRRIGIVRAAQAVETMLQTIDDIPRMRALREAHRAILDLLDETE